MAVGTLVLRPGSVISPSCGPDGHVRVVPARMAGLIGSTFDPALFDVMTLEAAAGDAPGGTLGVTESARHRRRR